jgi:RNA polymerase sigma-70 factor (ECF subfamily)
MGLGESSKGLHDPPTSDREAMQAFVERLRGLDHSAWAELFDRHHTQIWRYAYARTGDRDAADDVASQTFSEALTAIARYRYNGKPIVAWLYRIARNIAGKRARETRRTVTADHIELTAATPEDGLDALVLADALRRLTADQRDVIALRFVAGYSTTEIAGMMGKRETAVYSLEARAISALRRQLAEDSRNSTGKADEKQPLPGIDKVR